MTRPSRTRERKARHDHRGSLWIIAGGSHLWCYQCGAWTMNDESPAGRAEWHRPTGIGGENPAMRPARKKKGEK